MQKGSQEIQWGTEPRDTAAFQQRGRRGFHKGNRGSCQKAGGDQRQASSHPVTPFPFLAPNFQLLSHIPPHLPP